MPVTSWDQTDVQNLALVAWKEARGDGLAACVAVMLVCVNRVGFPGFAHTLHDVIYGKNQFTSMSVPSDPEYNLKPSAGDVVYAGCLTDATNVLQGTDDYTKGAHYYANLKTATSGWFFNNIVSHPEIHPKTVVIGKQTFFI